MLSTYAARRPRRRAARVNRAVQRSTKPGGMGMGLSISRSIIEAHGGRLWATPNEPHGASFHGSLPAASSLLLGTLALDDGPSSS
jgi:signal transduction histidine kinase